MVAELWKTHRAMRAELDANRSLIIPAGQTFELAVRLPNGKARIFWSGSKEGLGGLTVNEIDLESCAAPA